MEKEHCADGDIKILAEKLKVCGHPVRLKILCLIEKQDSCVTELWQCLDQSQPVISQHLAVLKEKEIVESDVQGNRRIYSISDPFIKNMVQSFPFLQQMGAGSQSVRA
ncbi:MAG: winged helix-turn-helix transcriptional regulator [Spirochaetales bacterium]|nr:winged helix-turn-helix transcriptional regulator [Spirochaetales bacterium]